MTIFFVAAFTKVLAEKPLPKTPAAPWVVSSWLYPVKYAHLEDSSLGSTRLAFDQ
jgi:hypothetical protein